MKQNPNAKGPATLSGDGASARRPLPEYIGWNLRLAAGPYRGSQARTKLSLATRKQREAISRPTVEEIGTKPFVVVTRKAMQASLDQRKGTQLQAKNVLDAMRGLFRWADGTRRVRPDGRLRAVKPKTEGFKIWTEDEVALFERKWPIRTREKLAFDLLLYAGLRRGDVAQLGHQRVKDGTLRVAKTGQVVTPSILPPLAESIAATRTGDLTFITTAVGRPTVKESFGSWFRDVCNAPAVKGSAHGLRKLSATRAADDGAIEANFG